MRNPRRRASLAIRQMGIETQQEHVVYMHRDCHVYRSEGFEAQTRVLISLNGRSIIATLNVVDPTLLESEEAALSNSVWQALAPAPGDRITVSYVPTLSSMSQMRAKIYSHRLDASALDSITSDVAAGSCPGIHTAAFLSACAGGRMDLQETISLTRTMLAAGKRLDWGHAPITDKHCVGGLPGDHTTSIVVSIITAAGFTIPKTSSRAITSPAGTADMIEAMTPMALGLEQMRRVVQRKSGCSVWGDSLTLNPTDDVSIHIERPLDLDSDAQLVASVLSKKIATSATHPAIDVPVGPTARVRSDTGYEHLKQIPGQVA